jgi:hypothetical protein
MKRLFLSTVAGVAVLLSISGCSNENEKNLPPVEESLEIPIVRQAPSPVKITWKNEPDKFRKIRFGTHINTLRKKHKMIFVKTGYGRLFEDKSSKRTTVAVAKLGGGSSADPIRDPEEHRCITCLSESGKRAKIYRISGDRMKIGSIPLDYIYYHFYRGRLVTVQIRFDGKYWYEMEGIFFDKFGEKDYRDDGSLNWHKWLGEDIYLKLWLVPMNELFEKGFIEYCYLPIKREDAKRYEEAKAAWGAKKKRRENEEKAKRKTKYRAAAMNDL